MNEMKKRHGAGTMSRCHSDSAMVGAAIAGASTCGNGNLAIFTACKNHDVSAVTAYSG